MSRTTKNTILFGAITLAFIALVSGLIWFTYREVGKTPGELMDYAERRLRGHSRLEQLVLPLIEQLRDVLNQPSAADLVKTPFDVPRPPSP